MKFRLSNGLSWDYQFTASSSDGLEAGCSAAWRQYVREHGITFCARLELHVGLYDFWVTSGQYTEHGQHKVPPTPHYVYRVSRSNRWKGLWMAASLSLEHARRAEALVDWVSSDTQQRHDIPALTLVQGGSRENRCF